MSATGGAKSTEIMSLEIPRGWWSQQAEEVQVVGGELGHSVFGSRMGAKPDVLKIDDEDDDLLANCQH